MLKTNYPWFENHSFINKQIESDSRERQNDCELFECKVVLFSQGAGQNSEAQQKAQQDRARQQEETKNSILSQIMDQNARARCKLDIYQALIKMF